MQYFLSTDHIIPSLIDKTKYISIHSYYEAIYVHKLLGLGFLI